MPPEYQALYSEAACGLAVTTTDGTFIGINETFCRWLGRQPDVLVGQVKFQDLLTVGGRIFHQTHWSPLLQIQGSIAEVKLDLVHASGRVIPMVMNAVRRPHGEKIVHELAMFVAEDRHKYERELLFARKRAEELLAKEKDMQRSLVLSQQRLHLALESSQLFLWDVDVPSRTPRYEDKIALLLGRPEPEPISHDVFEEHVHPDDLVRVRKAFQVALDPSAGNYDLVYRLRRIDRTERYVRATGSAHFDAQGLCSGFVGVLNDVTELHRQRAEAETRARIAEQMIGIVSHDLRNPLSAIHVSAVLLGRGNPSPNQTRIIERVMSSTARANRLIGDLLDFTQAQLGEGLMIKPHAVDLHQLVSDSVEELALAFPAQLIAHQPAGPSENCFVDADRVTQAIGNLVANAVSYGAKERPITVSSLVDESSFEVSVHNEGPAIPPELQSRIFEPMTRGEAAGASRSVGLGLFIVNQIAKAHGAVVSVESDAQKGTTFTMSFRKMRQE